MQFANNKFIATLVISNVLAFGVIFTLIWMLWNNNTNTSTAINTKNSSSENIQQRGEGNQKKSAPKKKTLAIADAITREVKSGNFNLNKPTGSETSGTDKLSDKEYIGAFKQMKENKKIVSSYTEKDITTVGASEQKNKNNLNTVDVSQAQGNAGKNNTLAQQVSSLVTEKKGDKVKQEKTNPGWKDYLTTLKVEGEERKNEMRTIKVKRGETLWRISIRAYGTGFKYKKIFKANPHLTNPHSITTGEILRVPL